MTIVSLAIGLLLCAEPSASPGADALQSPRPGRHGLLVLASGEVVEGKVAHADGKRIVVRLPDGSFRVFAAEVVRGLVTDRSAYGELPGSDQVRLVLVSGDVVAGRLLERSPTAVVVLEEPGSRQRSIPAEHVARLVQVREAPRELDSRSRHLAAPSARLLRAGEFQMGAQSLHLYATAGIVDFLTLTAGSTVPAWYTDAYGSNARASLRGGVTAFGFLAVAAGVEVDVAPAGSGAAYLSATATAVTGRAQFSLHVGPSFPGADQLARFGTLAGAVAATVPCHERIDLLVEAWASDTRQGGDVLLLSGLRWRAGRVALDLGAVLVPRGGEARPWVGIAFDPTPWRLEVKP